MLIGLGVGLILLNIRLPFVGSIAIGIGVRLSMASLLPENRGGLGRLVPRSGPQRAAWERRQCVLTCR
jgi:hypothetical protein